MRTDAERWAAQLKHLEGVPGAGELRGALRAAIARASANGPLPLPARLRGPVADAIEHGMGWS